MSMIEYHFLQIVIPDFYNDRILRLNTLTNRYTIWAIVCTYVQVLKSAFRYYSKTTFNFIKLH